MIFDSTQYFIPLKKIIIYVLFCLRTVFCYKNNNNNNNGNNNNNNNNNSNNNNNKQILSVVSYIQDNDIITMIIYNH